MTDKIHITLPLPPEQLHPNGRTRNHGYRAALVRRARGEACMVAKGFTFQCELASVHATFYMPRRRDEDGLAAWLKSYLDGFQDAGIVTNDSAFSAIGVSQVTGKEADGERKVILTIERLERP